MILGITGTIGAGKGTIVRHLAHTHGFAHFSARDILREEVRRRGLEINRDSMIQVANELRQTHGPDYIARRLFALAVAAGSDAVVESIRAVGEAEFLVSHGVRILAVDADRHVRFERIRERDSETDSVTYDEFCAQEETELRSDDPWHQNILGVMAMADATLMNDGDIDSLDRKVEDALLRLRQKPSDRN